MIECKTKKWGNSIGIILPKEELEKIDIGEGEDIIVEISKKGNGLKELFGFGKKNKITEKTFQETRKILERTI